MRLIGEVIQPEGTTRGVRSQRSFVFTLAIAALLLSATACATIAEPKGWSGPIERDGIILVSNEGELSALRGGQAGTYDEIWRFPDPDFNEDDDIEPEGIYGTPVVADGRVYFGAYDGSVYALEMATGRPAWPRPFYTGDKVIGGVVLGDGALYVGTDGGTLFGLALDSGQELWTSPFQMDKGTWSTPLLADGTLYVASLDGGLYAVDATSGQASGRWLEPFQAEAGLLSSPVLSDGLILVGGLGRKLHAVELDSGEPAWLEPFQADNWFWTRPYIEDGVVYVGSLDHNIYALELETGRQVWAQPFEARAPVRAAPIIQDGVLVVADRDGRVYGLDPDDGSLFWGDDGGPASIQYDLAGRVLGHPTILEGRGVLFSNQDGDLFLITVSDGDVDRIRVRTL